MLMALFVPKIFKFLSRFFVHVEKWLGKKDFGNFTIYAIIT